MPWKMSRDATGEKTVEQTIEYGHGTRGTISTVSIGNLCHGSRENPVKILYGVYGGYNKNRGKIQI